MIVDFPRISFRRPSSVFGKKENGLLSVIPLKTTCSVLATTNFLQHLRKKKLEFDFLDQIRWEVLAEVHNGPENRKEAKLQKLHHLIDQLPPRCREVFVKSKLEKRKYKEIAVDMGISIKTVENQMSKALHFLRENATGFLL